MSKTSKFINKGENMLSGRPASMEDFLNGNPGATVERKTVDNNLPNYDKLENSKNDTENSRRFELKMPEDLAKKVLDYAFINRKSKAAVIIDALKSYFDK